MSIASIVKGRLPKPPKNNLLGALLGWWQYGKELVTPGNYKTQINAFQSWVYICSSKNATAVAQTPLKVYVAKKSKDQKLIVPTKAILPATLKYLSESESIAPFVQKAAQIVEVTEHPFIDLKKNVNPHMTWFELLELTDLHQELTGNAYWYIVKNKFDMPVELWPVPPQFMRVVPDEKKFIKGYIYTYGTEEVPFDVDEIIHFKFPNPQSLYYGWAPLQSVAHAYNINDNMNTFENALFTNMARPEGVLSTEFGLTDAEFVRAKKEWKSIYGGAKNAGKTAILEKGLAYQPITLAPRELNFLNGRKVTKEEIANAYGVPQSKLGTTDVNKANAEAGDYQHGKDTVLPRLRRLEEKINEVLISLYGNEDLLFVAFDNPVPEDKEFMLKERELNLKTGFSSINEERKLAGREEVSWGNEPYVSNQFVPLGSIRDPGQAAGGKPGASGAKPGKNDEDKK